MQNSDIKICDVSYILCGTIGEGGAGVVYLARNKSDKYFAIKVVKNYNNPMVKELVNNEIQIQKKFTGNSNVIQYIDVEFTEKLAYIVLEIGMCSLRNVIEHKEIREKEFLNIVCDLCYGLNSIHSSGVIHRDVKPENVILKDGIYKITDFGVSCEKAEDESSTGTLPYWAPEIIFDSTQTFTNKVDIWSMGVTVFEVLFKINPFFHSKTSSFKQGMSEVKANIKKFTTPKFTIEAIIGHLKEMGLEEEAKYMEKKLHTIKKEILEILCLFFEMDPEKREDMSYFYLLFESVRESLPAPLCKKVQVNKRHNDGTIPAEIKMMIKTLDLIYELDAQFGSKMISEVVFSVQLSIWYFTGSTYGNHHLMIPENLERLKKHFKSKEEVWADIREGIIAYYFWMREYTEEISFFEKLNELKIHLLICANWNMIINLDAKFCQKIRQITKFEIYHPLEVFQLLQMYSENNINQIEEMIFSEFTQF